MGAGSMSSSVAPSGQAVVVAATPPTYAIWIKRFLIAMTILAALAIVGVGLWILGHIILPLVLLILSGVLAFVLYPAVKALARYMPPVVAVLITFLVVVVAVILLGGILINTLIQQL